jgi:23S rRNA (guanosine2251-2'-O)-methyltransferase
MEQLEGRQSILGALRARERRFEVLLLSHQAHTDKLEELLELAEKQKIPIKRVDGRELDAMAHGRSHGGVVAVCTPRPVMTCERLIETMGDSPLLLLLEGIDDARNLGFTIRTAAALSCAGVLVKKHLWDFDSADLARSSSGASERLPLVRIGETDELDRFRRLGVRLIGCIAGVRKSIYQADLRAGVILAIGGEKRGLSAAVRGMCDEMVRIPTAGGETSLALSHAAAIALAEAKRQRDASAGEIQNESPQ